MNYSTKVSSKDNAPPLNHSVFYKREFESNIMFFHLQVRVILFIKCTSLINED